MAASLCVRYDLPPTSDIRIRKALQMAQYVVDLIPPLPPHLVFIFSLTHNEFFAIVASKISKFLSVGHSRFQNKQVLIGLSVTFNAEALHVFDRISEKAIY